MTDLRTTYLSKTLRNPLIVSSSPITRDLDLVRRAEDAGAAAIVMHSLFEEQIDAESLDLHHHLDHGSESYAESLSYFPDMSSYNVGPDGYLEQLRRVKQAVSIPVYGSLNGSSLGGWIHYAKLMQDAGADGIELNTYDIPTDPLVGSAEIENKLVALVWDVREKIKIPLAVKLSSFFTSPGNMIQRLKQAGANAVVLFNRFYQPDFDIDHLDVVPHLKFSNSEELLTRLHWCGIIYGRVPVDIAITGGAHTGRDAIKCCMAGASAVMMTSALMRHGPEHLKLVLDEMQKWMIEKDYGSIAELQGCLSLQRVPDPRAFERGNYMRILRQHSGRIL